MAGDLPLLIWLTESEYNGTSFNGPGLAKWLKTLTLDQVTSTNTLEGYTVWGIVLHLMYWKDQLLRELGATDPPPFPYAGKDFPALPEVQSAAAWQQTLAEQDVLHTTYIAALRAFPAEKLGEKMAWGCTYRESIAWMATHDTYHTAMMRNMGVPGTAGAA